MKEAVYSPEWRKSKRIAKLKKELPAVAAIIAESRQQPYEEVFAEWWKLAMSFIDNDFSFSLS